jgi:hypothetical protein
MNRIANPHPWRSSAGYSAVDVARGWWLQISLTVSILEPPHVVVVAFRRLDGWSRQAFLFLVGTVSRDLKKSMAAAPSIK